MDFEYGQRVVATKRLRKAYEIRPHKRGSYTRGYRLWKEFDAAIEGIFLGTRFLQEGWLCYDYEEGYSFNCTERQRVALISPGPNLNPIYVPLDCIENESH